MVFEAPGLKSARLEFSGCHVKPWRPQGTEVSHDSAKFWAKGGLEEGGSDGGGSGGRGPAVYDTSTNTAMSV